MAKREEFTLTIEQAQRLVETSAIVRNGFPKKWGEKEVPIDEQLVGREDANDLYKTLRVYSPWMQGIGVDYRLIFGDKSDWYPADKDQKRILEKLPPDDPKIASWKFENATKSYKVRLSREALSGVVWCCIVRLHPHTPIGLSGRDSVEFWWSITDVIGKRTAVSKYIGLASAKRTEFEDDPEPEAAEEKKA